MDLNAFAELVSVCAGTASIWRNGIGREELNRAAAGLRRPFKLLRRTKVFLIPGCCKTVTLGFPPVFREDTAAICALR